MKSNSKLLGLLIIFTVLISTSALAQGYGRNGGGVTGMNIHEEDIENQLVGGTMDDLSQEEIDGLLLMREEEKLARDVYLTLYDEWNLNVFSNIAKSEQTHTNAVKSILDAYDVNDIVVSDEIGVFENEELQNIYDSLIEQGSESLLAATIVGATVEDLDINDLNKLMSETANEDILLVYDNLNKGSRNHLRAFMRQVERNGGTYEPAYISQEEFDTILSGSQETGSLLNENSDINNAALMGNRGASYRAGNPNGMQVNQANAKGYQQNINVQEKRAGVANSLSELRAMEQTARNNDFGKRVSEIATSYEKSYGQAIQIEDKINSRSGFTRFFMGGDSELAENLNMQVQEHKKLIQDLTDSFAGADAEDLPRLQAQVGLLNQEANRLYALANQEANQKGLFKWW